MPFNTRNNYTSGDALDFNVANGIGNDLRTLGDNVNANNKNISNLGILTFNASAQIRPGSNSTTAIQFQNSSGASSALTIDTTNLRVGVGVTPSTKLDVKSASSIDGITIQSVDRASLWLTTTGPSNLNWLIQTAVTANNDLQILASAAAGGSPTGNVLTLKANSGNPLQMASGAYVSSGGTWTNASDRAKKENFERVNVADILRLVRALPIQAWNYIAEPGVRHIGPMAQDFAALFAVGADDTSISTVDSVGVLFAAVQALAARVEALEGA